MRNGRLNLLLFVGTAVFIFNATSYAGLISVNVADNDCAGFFGQGFDNCNVFGQSPVIAKFEANNDGLLEGAPEINNLFPTVTGGEWSFTEDTGLSGTWKYNPGAGDPPIKFWAVKTSPQLNFSYMVPDADQAHCSTPGNELNIECITAALVLPTDTAIPWETGVQNVISHITFYDSDGGRVPAPGTMLLMALGGLALGMRRRQRRL